MYRTYSCKLYKALADFEDKETIYLDFNKWKNDGIKELEKIWGILGWKYPIEASQAALIKSESHKNRPTSFEILPADEIRADLHEAY